MPSATITSNGQVTIPRRIREVLQLGPGDRIDFVINDEGRPVPRGGAGPRMLRLDEYRRGPRTSRLPPRLAQSSRGLRGHRDVRPGLRGSELFAVLRGRDSGHAQSLLVPGSSGGTIGAIQLQ